MLILSGNFKNHLDREKHLAKENFEYYNGVYFKLEKAKKISDKCFLIGEIEYCNDNGKRKRVNTSKDLRIVDKEKNIYDKLKCYEGSYALIRFEDNRIGIYADRFCKKDIYYYAKNSDFIISDSLEWFFKLGIVNGYDEISLVSFFTLYGNYTPKGNTLYKSIYRLKPNTYILLDKKGISTKEIEFKPLNTMEYTTSKLDDYYDILIDSIKYRSSEKGINWIYLSSGWDSTAILALLRELYPANKVRGVIGEMVYSQRSGVINKYETDRAKKIAKYYGIGLDTVHLNFLNTSITSYLENIIPFMRNNSIYSFNTLNFCMLSDFIGKRSSENDVVFSGEISDGVHNLGFSQYATILDHPDLNFREYADKMASYLFSPSFLKSVLENNFEKDTVYNYFRQRSGVCKYTDVSKLNTDKKKIEYLASFFLSQRRFPFYNMENLPMFGEKARSDFGKTYKKEYLEVLASKMNYSNFYSTVIYLYNLFHWQGSTVKVIGKSLERYGKSIKLPFWDSELHKFLSQMPESWGRGLDLNRTKYPLKWILENKTDYPMHLQKGPHSYLYDSNPRFSHLAEILYGRELNSMFKDKLNLKKLECVLDDKYFNINYIKKIIGEYKKNKDLSGQMLNDLGSLILFSLIA